MGCEPCCLIFACVVRLQRVRLDCFLALQLLVGLLQDAAGILAHLVPPFRLGAAADLPRLLPVEFYVELVREQAQADAEALGPRFSTEPFELADR
jgi:hypothetical protein